MIALITYDRPHRKTQDLIWRLLIKGYSDIHLIVLPWEERKCHVPIFRHRTCEVMSVSIDELAERLILGITRVDDLDAFLDEKKFDHVLIGGAPIISDKHKIINSHPGYLPNVRGLDALKWGIYSGQPIGVTTHYISSEADAGQLIERRIVPVYFEDTFHAVAQRVYETEIEMLVNTIGIAKNASLESLEDNRYPVHKRMPHHLEMIMMQRFEERRKKSPSWRSE